MEQQGVHNASTTIPSTTLISKSLAIKVVTAAIDFEIKVVDNIFKWKNIPNLNQLNHVFHHSIKPAVASTSQHSEAKFHA